MNGWGCGHVRLRVVGYRVGPDTIADFERNLGADLIATVCEGEGRLDVAPTRPGPTRDDADDLGPAQSNGPLPDGGGRMAPFISVISGCDETAMAEALAANGCAVVEPGAAPRLDAGELRSLLMRNDFLLSFSTRTGYAVNVSALLVDHLRRLTQASEPWLEGVRLAISEAVGNALLHGNLELESNKDASANSFALHAERVAVRLEDPRFGARRVDLAVCWPNSTVPLRIQVTDHGPGYDPGLTEAAPGPAQPSGRGLRLVRDLCVRYDISKGGSSITMEFAL